MQKKNKFNEIKRQTAIPLHPKGWSSLAEIYMECSMNDSAPFLLYFGEKIYQITVLNYEPILKFILEKAKSTLDWDTAKTFDLKYKKNEYGLLKKYFTINQLY